MRASKRVAGLGLGMTALAVAGLLWTARESSREGVGRGSDEADTGLLRTTIERQAAEIENLRTRLAKLGRELELATAKRSLPEREPGAAPETEAPPEEDSIVLADRSTSRLKELRDRALDPRAAARDRILAVHDLWFLDLKAGTSSAITPEIVDANLGLLAVEADPELRRMACFNVLDRAEARHASILIGVLQADASADVRAQAADSLQTLQDLPTVRSALEWASRTDASELVRETATEMLGRWPEDGSSD